MLVYKDRDPALVSSLGRLHIEIMGLYPRHTDEMTSRLNFTVSISRATTQINSLFMQGVFRSPEFNTLQRSVSLLPRFNHLVQKWRNFIVFVLANPATVSNAKDPEIWTERAYMWCGIGT